MKLIRSNAITVEALADPEVVAIQECDTDCRAVQGAPERVRQFTISTGDVDAHNSTLKVKGWDLARYKKNGTLLWAHNADLPPIGRAVKVWSEGDSLKAQFEFTDAEQDHPLGRGFGASIMRLYDQGFLKGVSVGFRPVEWKLAEARDDGKGPVPVDFTKQELLEVSAVPVPSNPNALHEAVSRGLGAEVTAYRAAVERCAASDVEHPILTRALCAEILMPREVAADVIVSQDATEETPVIMTETRALEMAIDETVAAVAQAEVDHVARMVESIEVIRNVGKLTSDDARAKLLEVAELIRDLCEQDGETAEEDASPEPVIEERAKITVEQVRALVREALNARRKA